MSKSAAVVDSNANPGTSRAKQARKPRVQQNRGSRASLALAPNEVQPSAFPAKPLLIGVGLGAALALTAVALGSRPAKSSSFGSRPPTIAGAFTKTAVVVLARIVARRALAAAAKQGARKLASAWPL
ncbi:MAG: hypothetical protein WDO69_20155 [Pseudomonadota bacterium]